MNSVKRGDVSVIKVIGSLLEAGFDISQPVSENSRYDIIVDNGIKLLKIQIKTIFWHKIENAYYMNCFSVYRTKKGLIKERYNDKQVDFIIGFNPVALEYYVFPINDIKTQCIVFNPPRLNKSGTMSLDVSKYKDRFDLLRTS